MLISLPYKEVIELKPMPKILFSLSVALTSVLMGTTINVSQTVQSQAISSESIDLPIIMYHHILEEESQLNDYTISPQEFRTDLKFLQEQGYTPIVVQDLIQYTQGGELPEKPIMLTFDDGYESFAVYAFPLLQEYHFPAVYAVIGTYADLYSQQDEHHVRYSHSNWETLKALQESGLVEIQNHSYDLHSLQNGERGAQKRSNESAGSYQKRLWQDLDQLQKDCRQHLDGWTPTCFAYPFGFSSPEALPVLQQLGFSAAMTCEEKINQLTGDPEELYHLKRFNRPHGKSVAEILAAA